ncbi:hypothetical protein KKC45_00470 [Patescibacteria group bacterium]|nr:hypothetical protein [Patescibacteria group bacterium]
MTEEPCFYHETEGGVRITVGLYSAFFENGDPNPPGHIIMKTDVELGGVREEERNDNWEQARDFITELSNLKF